MPIVYQVELHIYIVIKLDVRIRPVFTDPVLTGLIELHACTQVTQLQIMQGIISSLHAHVCVLPFHIGLEVGMLSYCTIVFAEGPPCFIDCLGWLSIYSNITVIKIHNYCTCSLGDS